MFQRQPSPIHTKQFYVLYKANIDTLVKLFPLSFNKDFPLPLELGCHKEIQKATGWQPWKVHAVMCMWTARMEYVMMCCSEKYRYQLNGVRSDHLSEDHIANFVIRLNCFKDRSRIAQFVKDYAKAHKQPALLNVPIKQRPDLSRWM